MEEKQNIIKYKFHFNVSVVIFVIVQFVFVFLLLISIPRLLQPSKIDEDDLDRQPILTVGNISSTMPEDYPGFTRDMEVTLFELALRNSTGRDTLISAEAFIRENSVKTVYFDNQNINYLSAIIDIPDLKQSYWFYNEYSDDNSNQYIDYSKTYRILCLEKSQEIIYSDFECEDDFGVNGRFELVQDLIGFLNFNYFSLSYSFRQDYNEIDIYPYNFNESNRNKKSYIKQAQDAIDSLGIPSDLFIYYIMEPEDIDYTYSQE